MCRMYHTTPACPPNVQSRTADQAEALPLATLVRQTCDEPPVLVQESLGEHGVCIGIGD
jgi:hypothetical protein